MFDCSLFSQQNKLRDELVHTRVFITIPSKCKLNTDYLDQKLRFFWQRVAVGIQRHTAPIGTGPLAAPALLKKIQFKISYNVGQAAYVSKVLPLFQTAPLHIWEYRTCVARWSRPILTEERIGTCCTNIREYDRSM
jgi:hypothetical protein